MGRCAVMARHPRLILPDVALHIRQRGNDGQYCFRHESDRLVYLSNLGEFCRRWRCALHAYCLMTNHVHLLLTPPDSQACALLMRDLGRCYVRYFNRRHGRTGSLWEGRFRSCLVESQRYVLGCHRYIELNPVRAGMVRAPDAYAWSSYAGNGRGREDSLLTPHAEYLALAETASRRCASYRGLFQDKEDRDLTAAFRAATDGGYPLVGNSLKARLAAQGARVERGKPGPREEEGKDGDEAGAELEFSTEE
jgi:putative transposase